MRRGQGGTVSDGSRAQALDKGPRLNSVRLPRRDRAPARGLASTWFSQVLRPLGGSSNGRTADSGSAYQGSNPFPPAAHVRQSPTRSVSEVTSAPSSRP